LIDHNTYYNMNYIGQTNGNNSATCMNWAAWTNTFPYWDVHSSTNNPNITEAAPAIGDPAGN